MIIPTMNAPWFRKSFKSDHKKLLMIIIPSANEVRGGGGGKKKPFLPAGGGMLGRGETSFCVFFGKNFY